MPAYDSLADLLAEFPVPAEQAVHTLEVLDARISAERNRVVDLSGP